MPAVLGEGSTGDSSPVQVECRAKLGLMESRLKLYSLEEVQAHNAAGDCWLILDGALWPWGLGLIQDALALRHGLAEMGLPIGRGNNVTA